MSVILDVLAWITAPLLLLTAAGRLYALTLGRAKPAMTEPGARNKAWRDFGYCMLLAGNTIYLIPVAAKHAAPRSLAVGGAALAVLIGAVAFAHLRVMLTSEFSATRVHSRREMRRELREVRVGLLLSLLAAAGLLSFALQGSTDEAAQWLVRIAGLAICLWVLSALPRPRMKRKSDGQAPDAP